ncbi:hypothetical protein PAECIP112173_02427 [Paenibacillus sp. JJ-100]|uniref:DUF1801 domain-containing protein n=1 Tax=Paenibacillus sp. JJ-100 TaxID=2974896 RepID=UPI0022FF6C25|nr:DUF1801 domain-containing protein [Paenibacillus sp. JJ-100]CAI6076453.1 hypothetical protein PAECIP112173_02427 [Paenibacillus sp. JJ-100]
MNHEVTEYIESLKEPWQSQVCNELRELVHSVIPDAQERIQYKKPHFLKNGKYAADISTSKDAVSFTIFNATALTYPEGFDGPAERKTMKLRQEQEWSKELLTSLLSQAASTLK